MDIVEVLKAKITSLPAGDHRLGLLAVDTHIRCGVRHLQRGQDELDETAFTDAIYRCNQAFEGSVKEAYRVLAGKNPQKRTPAQIEDFLASNQILRQRVLDQFTTYRQQWRNPSTHDYTLDFDSSEALLAIVSVTAFAIVLCDQIQTAIAAKRAEEEAADKPHQSFGNENLQHQVTALVQEFALSHEAGDITNLSWASRDLEGALAGFLSAGFSDSAGIRVEIGQRVEGREADVLVSRDADHIAIEVKFFSSIVPSRVFSGLSYLDTLIDRGITTGMLLAYDPTDKNVVTVAIGLRNGRTITAIMSHSVFEACRDYFPSEENISYVTLGQK